MAKRSSARSPQAQKAQPALRTETRLRALEKAVDENRHDLDLQFRRIAQMQVEIDAVKKSKGQR